MNNEPIYQDDLSAEMITANDPAFDAFLKDYQQAMEEEEGIISGQAYPDTYMSGLDINELNPSIIGI